ncbi:hypothetical protein AVEN_133985-1 [Araneus ventricosus]|uniref:Uncharacterized protein n=1 Tax=Araneus ventricosus TaxID=182803 RepID=A0A4Y2X8X6_ARAVE|nr:hypothetical protein AVEN_133985-1 [Araneus ventricosus]
MKHRFRYDTGSGMIPVYETPVPGGMADFIFDIPSHGSGCSTPSSLEGSQLSTNSQQSISNSLSFNLFSEKRPPENLYTPDGHGNSPDCIKLRIKWREYQDRIELLEDELFRIVPCPLPWCLVHQNENQSRSICSPAIETSNKLQPLMDLENQIETPKDTPKNLYPGNQS